MLLPSVFTNDFTNDDFFDDFFNAPTRRNYMPSASMKCDVKELDQSYQIDMQLPGYDKDDVEVSVDKGYLTVSASHKENKEDKEDGKYIRKECFTGSCRRSFYVGDAIKGEDISAAFNNGILSLTVPKAEALPQNETKQLVHIEG